MGTSADYRLTMQSELMRAEVKRGFCKARVAAPALGYMRTPCPDCDNYTMVNHRGYWKCDTCGEEGDN